MVVSCHSFDYVKSAGANIYPIRLAGDQEASAKVLKHTTGTGPTYPRANQNIGTNEEVSALKVSIP